MICNLNTPSSSPRGLKSPYVRTTACWGPEVCYPTNTMGIYGSLCHLESISHPACHPGWKRKVTLGMVMGGMCCQCLAPSGDPIGFESCLWGKIPIPACVEAGGEHIAHHCPSYLGWCPSFPEMSTETVQRADGEKQAEAIWREPCRRLSGCPSQCWSAAQGGKQGSLGAGCQPHCGLGCSTVMLERWVRTVRSQPSSAELCFEHSSAYWKQSLGRWSLFRKLLVQD